MLLKGRAVALVGLDLAGYVLKEMIEVCKLNEDGIKSGSLGFFNDPDVATAFADSKNDPSGVRVSAGLVLSNGQFHFMVAEISDAILFDEKKEKEALKELALSKLSSAEKRMLGISS